jgi:hypothetical protein
MLLPGLKCFVAAHTKDEEWFLRRTAILVILVVALLLLGWTVVITHDAGIATQLVILLLGTVGAYLTGTVVDDKLKGRKVAPPPDEAIG